MKRIAILLSFAIFAFGLRADPNITTAPTPAVQTPAQPVNITPPPPAIQIPPPVTPGPVAARPTPQQVLDSLIAIDNGLNQLHAAQAAAKPPFAQAAGTSHPTATGLLLLRALLGILATGVIHPLLERYNKKNLSTEQNSAVRTGGGKAFQIFNWIVGLVTGISPSVIAASASVPKEKVAAEAEYITRLPALLQPPPSLEQLVAKAVAEALEQKGVPATSAVSASPAKA